MNAQWETFIQGNNSSGSPIEILMWFSYSQWVTGTGMFTIFTVNTQSDGRAASSLVNGFMCYRFYLGCLWNTSDMTVSPCCWAYHGFTIGFKNSILRYLHILTVFLQATEKMVSESFTVVVKGKKQVETFGIASDRNNFLTIIIRTLILWWL